MIVCWRLLPACDAPFRRLVPAFGACVFLPLGCSQVVGLRHASPWWGNYFTRGRLIPADSGLLQVGPCLGRTAGQPAGCPQLAARGAVRLLRKRVCARMGTLDSWRIAALVVGLQAGWPLSRRWHRSCLVVPSRLCAPRRVGPRRGGFFERAALHRLLVLVSCARARSSI